MPNPQAVAEARSIAYHREIADLLPSRPDILEAARARLARWLVSGEVAEVYARAWRRVLDQPVEEIRAALTDPGLEARDLRQVSPFAGALDARVRWRIHRVVRERLSDPVGSSR